MLSEKFNHEINFEKRKVRIKEFYTGSHHVFSELSNPQVVRYYGIRYSSLEATKSQINWFNDFEKQQIGQWRAISSGAGDVFSDGIGFNHDQLFH